MCLYFFKLLRLNVISSSRCTYSALYRYAYSLMVTLLSRVYPNCAPILKRISPHAVRQQYCCSHIVIRLLPFLFPHLTLLFVSSRYCCLNPLCSFSYLYKGYTHLFVSLKIFCMWFLSILIKCELTCELLNFPIL